MTAGSLRTEGLILAHCLRLQVCHVSPQLDLFGNTFSDLAEVYLPGDCRSSDVDAED